MSQANRDALPRWRGFNLLYFYNTKSDCTPLEEDFRWMADWSFDFVRLPMCYLLWTEQDDIYRVKEDVLARIDQAVELGRRFGLHVDLNFHRAPGYSVNRERTEPFSLWTDQAALDAFCFHWELFAKRYRGISSKLLSFNPINEPPADGEKGMTRQDHERVIRAVTAAIRQTDPERLVIVDGLPLGRVPLPELFDLQVAQSCRGYMPRSVSHYMAKWVGGEKFPVPTWPNGDVDLAEYFKPWGKLVEQGIGVHCGECGCFNKTPRAVFLAWFADVLDILGSHGIGYALWNLRGSFGILDSGREDTQYTDWHGHQLDAGLLELLQRH